MPEARYLALFRSGELERRAEALEARLAACDICPHECGDNRLRGERGFCRMGRLPQVASVCAHLGEEPAVSGSAGSGTVFFSGCNLRCIYCQNHQISQSGVAAADDEDDGWSLAEGLLYLQNELGCHNVNFVSPSHFVPQMVRALFEAAGRGFTLPVVYNTASYDSLATLRALDGIVDIYLADLRYASDKWAFRLSRAVGYRAHSRAAIKEMYRQVGLLDSDEDGVGRSGLIVRHLVLPEDIAGSRDSLTWLAEELSPEVTVSIMSQYHPAHRAGRLAALRRTISLAEYDDVVDLLSSLGMDNGWVQEMGADGVYLPDFERDGHPFMAAP
jgi:putative pyruvate formate lyase activating enzyme